MTLNEARALLAESPGPPGVVYRPEGRPPEDGVITDVNERYVFVRYRGDQHSKATDPGMLEPLGARHGR